MRLTSVRMVVVHPVPAGWPSMYTCTLVGVVAGLSGSKAHPETLIEVGDTAVTESSAPLGSSLGIEIVVHPMERFGPAGELIAYAQIC